MSENVQDYCDWCFGALTEPARARSRWLGLATEDAWACSECLGAGRYRLPPDHWIGHEEAWLATDEYVLSADDRTVIVNALNEVLHGPDAVEDWEFGSRLGVSRSAALQTLLRIRGES
ncbi:MAG: hypothetical protein ACRDT7_07915 [Microbacterium sp.]